MSRYGSSRCDESTRASYEKRTQMELRSAPRSGREALIPAGVTAGTTLVRTKREDTILRKELEGCRDYTRQVRYPCCRAFGKYALSMDGEGDTLLPREHSRFASQLI